jgi:hypothetical protein
LFISVVVVVVVVVIVVVLFLCLMFYDLAFLSFQLASVLILRNSPGPHQASRDRYSRESHTANGESVEELQPTRGMLVIMTVLFVVCI